MIDLTPMKNALDAMHKGTLSPEVYKNREEITAACQEGKIFACKCHRIVLFGGIFCLILGIIMACIGVVFVVLVQARFPDMLLDASLTIIGGGVFFVADIFLWIIGRSRFLLVGPSGMVVCPLHTPSFLPALIYAPIYAPIASNYLGDHGRFINHEIVCKYLN